MTLVCKQCDEAMLTKLALRPTYEVDRNNGNLVNFLDLLQFICYQNNNVGLFYTHYEGVIATKWLLNFTNPRLEDPHEHKEELKVKYSATPAVAGKFPNGIVFLEILLAKKTALLDWNNYCTLP